MKGRTITITITDGGATYRTALEFAENRVTLSAEEDEAIAPERPPLGQKIHRQISEQLTTAVNEANVFAPIREASGAK